MTLGVDLGLERDKLRSRCLSEIKSFSLCFRIILLNSEMLQYWQLSKFLDWSWRNSLPFSVKLWFLVKERGAIGASLKIFSKCWLEIELKGSSLLRRACRTAEDWRFLYVFCQDFYKQYEPFTVLHRSQQIALCFLATAFQNMSHGSLTIVVVMAWSKISSGDRMDIVVFIFVILI